MRKNLINTNENSKISCNFLSFIFFIETIFLYLSHNSEFKAEDCKTFLKLLNETSFEYSVKKNCILINQLSVTLL